MTRGLAVLALVATYSIAPAASQRIVPRERTLQVAGQAGQELRIQNYASWDRDCRPLPIPQITIRHQPMHGTVSIRPGVSTVSVIREGAANCTGHQYQGTTVWYLPVAGYGGPDQFDYDVVTTRSTAHDTVMVDVRR